LAERGPLATVGGRHGAITAQM